MGRYMYRHMPTAESPKPQRGLALYRPLKCLPTVRYCAGIETMPHAENIGTHGFTVPSMAAFLALTPLLLRLVSVKSQARALSSCSHKKLCTVIQRKRRNRNGLNAAPPNVACSTDRIDQSSFWLRLNPSFYVVVGW